MKFNMNKIGSLLIAALAVVSGFSLQSCEDEPDKFELSSGKPTVYYVRPADVNKKDSLLVQANPSDQLCLVGDNMKSVEQLYFNDQKAVLNTSYITDHALLVTVPSDIPNTVSDKIYMITKDNDTIPYDFHVVVPAPVISEMSNEYAAAGSTATITGSYFVDDPNVPLTITFPNGTVIKSDELISKTRGSLTFTVPQCDTEGPITITSIYGKTKSVFYYKDTRGLLFDFDGKTGLGNHGWHTRTITSDATSLSGNFVQLGDAATTMSADGGWNDGAYSFEYWPGEWTTPLSYVKGVSQKLTDLADFSNYQNMAIKFEMYIPKSNPWMAGAMQIIMAGVDKITGAGGGLDTDGVMTASANNTFFNNDVLPRGIYRPWETTGSYDTGDQWVTVTIPISTFKYGINGGSATGSLSVSDFASLTIFITGGGIKGTACQPIVKIDNIRAVPIK